MKLQFTYLVAVCGLLANSAGVMSLHAQEPPLTELDKNEDGRLQRSEIPQHFFSVISRYASLAGATLDDSVDIGVLESGRQKYFDQLSAALATPPKAGKQTFGRLPDGRVRSFGSLVDLEEDTSGYVTGGVVTIFRKFDANRDALLSTEELSLAYRSRSQSWLRGDRDGNHLLTPLELARAIAAEQNRRSISRAESRSTWQIDGVTVTPQHRQYADRLMNNLDKDGNGRLEGREIPAEWRSGRTLQWADSDRDGRVTQNELRLGAVAIMQHQEAEAQRRKDPAFADCRALATDMIRRFDKDRDRALSRWEWRPIGAEVSAADANRNQLIHEPELTEWLYSRITSQPSELLPDQLPAWFAESDIDRDAQVSLAEFYLAQGVDQRATFQFRDRNGDGVVTAAEAVESSGAGKVQFTNRAAQVLPAAKLVVSEIVVDDPITIADIDVRVLILKDGDDDLELRLSSPAGKTATLYYTNRRKAWGGGRMFENTLIDDEAPQADRRLPSPPSHRSFRPQSVGQRTLQSLSAFYGKPARGTWRLEITNKAQNAGNAAGLLQGWSLLIKPAEAKR